MFNINSITIYKECMYRKNLETGTYLFGEMKLKEFFGKNVTLHTIVGKNGSGKSSLLDIMFRMVNNVGAVMCKQETREAADRVRYARHIFADIEYNNGVGYKLCARDTLLWIESSEDVYWLSDSTLKSKAVDVDVKYLSSLLKQRYGDAHFHDYSDMRPQERKSDVAKMLFYTVATNYSMLGFQSADYDDEDSLEWDDKIFVTTNDGLYLVTSDDKYVTVADWVEKKNWITGVFHKNDGYMCPIVLNPFRSGGQINMDNEAALTVSRLSALLISQDMNKNPLIEDYYLDYIEYERKKDFFKKFKPIYSKDKEEAEIEKKNLLEDGGDLNRFEMAAIKKGTATNIILNQLGCQLLAEMSQAEMSARMYVVYKILNIAATYPFYQEYSKYGDINWTISAARLTLPHAKLRELVDKIVERRTHIEQKVHQALHFITLMNDARNNQENYDDSWLNRPFTFEEYQQKLDLPTRFESIEQCLRYLPPNMYKQTIYLKRWNKDKGEWERKIPFKKMSSGQKQMLYQLSTLIYHLLNLKSVPETQVKYNNVSIVLDEIEVCFHPEYQRMFISRLLELLVDRLHLNEAFGIHILMTTHSPFILSDIPNELISYMENGHQLTMEEQKVRNIRKPMAGNISELLHQSFFLHEGFIGEYARRKILSLVKYLKEDDAGDDHWDRQQAKLFIDGISEPFINKQLTMLYEMKNEEDTNR